MPDARGHSRSSVELAIAEFMHALHLNQSIKLSDVWMKITRAATALLPPVAHASITMVDKENSVRSQASTDRTAAALEHVHQLYLQGPGVEAARNDELIQVDDLACEGRWPTFAANAAGTAARAVLSLPLFRYERESGALNLWADQPQAFGRDAVELGRIFTLTAAVVVDAAHRETRIDQVLTNREIVGQAKGVLMERFKIDAVAASFLINELAERHGQSVPATARTLLRRNASGVQKR
jgi:GAF domain/ANTAR domain